MTLALSVQHQAINLQGNGGAGSRKHVLIESGVADFHSDLTATFLM